MSAYTADTSGTAVMLALSHKPRLQTICHGNNNNINNDDNNDNDIE